MANSVRYRAANKSDLRFVISAWTRSFAHQRKVPEGLTPKRYREALRNTVLDILRRNSVRVVVACNPLNDRLIWGFAVYEAGPSPVLHYCYVKEVFRGNGIGGELVAIARDKHPGVLHYSYRTPACRTFLAGAEFDKKLLRRSAEV